MCVCQPRARHPTPNTRHPAYSPAPNSAPHPQHPWVQADGPIPGDGGGSRLQPGLAKLHARCCSSVHTLIGDTLVVHTCWHPAPHARVHRNAACSFLHTPKAPPRTPSPPSHLPHALTHTVHNLLPAPHTCAVPAALPRAPTAAQRRSQSPRWGVGGGHVPMEGVHHQAVGFIQPLDHGVLEGAVQPGHVDLLLVGVVAGPEEVSGNPIHREAVSVGQV